MMMIMMMMLPAAAAVIDDLFDLDLGMITKLPGPPTTVSSSLRDIGKNVKK